MSHQEHTFPGKIVSTLLFNTLADKLFLPYRMICFNTVVSVIAVFVLYLLFCLIYFPLWLLSLVITTYGAWLVLIVLLQWLVLFIVKSISFPGGSSSNQRQIAQEIIAKLSSFVEKIAESTNQYSSLIMLMANNGNPINNFDEETLNDILQSSRFFPFLIIYFKETFENLKHERMVDASESKLLTHLLTSMEEYYSAFIELNQFIQEVKHQTPNRQISLALLPLAGKCLQTSERMRISCEVIKPTPGTGSISDDDTASQVFFLVKQLFSFPVFSSFQSTLSLSEKISFPYMRSILKLKYHGKSCAIKGSNNNFIDGILFHANLNQNIATTTMLSKLDNTPGKERINSSVVVIFCNPNAAHYETLSQSNVDQSYFGLYLSLGFDVFYYNYRSYGRSEGNLSPSSLKEDSLLVFKYIQAMYKNNNVPVKIIVHGQSIGGMIASHIANHCPVSGLICDRTFASLDATACRIIGNWAGFSVRYGAFWNTNIVKDYLNINHCPKLFIHDVNDEIIADASSLKHGISKSIFFSSFKSSILPCLNSKVDTNTIDPCKTSLFAEDFMIIHEPSDYEYSNYKLTEPLPNESIALKTFLPQSLSSFSSNFNTQAEPNSSNGNLSIDTSVSSPKTNFLSNSSTNKLPLFTKEFIVHLFACCKRLKLFINATDFERNKSKAEKHRSPPSTKTNSNAIKKTVQSIEMVNKQGGLSGQSTNIRDHEEVDNPFDLENGLNDDKEILGLEHNEDEEDDDSELLSQIKSPTSSNYSTSTNSSLSYSSRSSYRARSPIFKSLQGLTVSQLFQLNNLKKIRCLHTLDILGCPESIMDDYYFKVYVSITRVDNGFGYLLGNAINRGLDSFHSWCLSYIVWKHSQVTCTGALKGQGRLMQGTPKVNDRNSLPKAPDSQSQFSFESSIDISDSLSELNTLKALYQKIKISSDDINHLQPSLDHCVEFIIHSLTWFQALYEECEYLYQESLTNPPIGVSRVDISPNDFLNTKTLGTHLPVHCGHNGWLASNEIESLKAWLYQNNFTLNSSSGYNV